MEQKSVYVGIRREDWSEWERRAPLIPRHVKEISKDYPYIKFIVQPCGKRAFHDQHYANAGAIIKEDLFFSPPNL